MLASSAEIIERMTASCSSSQMRPSHPAHEQQAPGGRIGDGRTGLPRPGVRLPAHAGYDPSTLIQGSLQARHFSACATGWLSMLPSMSMKKT